MSICSTDQAKEAATAAAAAAADPRLTPVTATRVQMLAVTSNCTWSSSACCTASWTASCTASCTASATACRHPAAANRGHASSVGGGRRQRQRRQPRSRRTSATAPATTSTSSCSRERGDTLSRRPGPDHWEQTLAEALHPPREGSSLSYLPHVAVLLGLGGLLDHQQPMVVLLFLLRSRSGSGSGSVSELCAPSVNQPPCRNIAPTRVAASVEVRLRRIVPPPPAGLRCDCPWGAS